MAVRMRLRREGKKKQPFYRVVVADVRSPRDGRFIEDIGYYQPLSNPSTISIDRDRALHWLNQGVQPSDAVRKLLRIEGIWEEFKPGDPGRDRSQKHEQRAERAKSQEQARRQAEAARRPTPEPEAAPEPEPAPEAEAPAEQAEAPGEQGGAPKGGAPEGAAQTEDAAEAGQESEA